MIIELKSDFNVLDSNMEEINIFKAGTVLTAINKDYVCGDDVVFSLNQYSENFKEYFIVYHAKKYIAIPKNICHVPKIIDGWFNK